MMCITRLRQKIVALTVLTLVVSVVKIVYELHSAQHAIDLSDRDRAQSRPPFPPHWLATTVGLGSNPSLRAYFRWAVSRARNKSRASRADAKIDSDKTGYIPHVQQGHDATSRFASNGVLVSAFSQPWVSPVGKKTQLRLVIVVCSKPENTELRLAIRRSWGLELDKPDVVLRFFVGQDDGWDDIIEREQALHSDVIRTDYVDSYENLSYKVLAAISWALHSIGPPLYIMKIDDDTYVNLPYLLHELRNRSVISDATHRYVMGAVCLDSPVVRDDGDKWFVSYLDYPSDVYPTYVFGGGYVMTRAAAESVLAASLKVEYLHLEDVFITGILARAAGVAHVSHPGFAFWTSRRPSPCDVVTGRRLTAVNLTSKQFYIMYSGIHAILRAGNWTQC